MPKGSNDYIDKDLSQLYEQEKIRKKMSELAQENIEEGKSLNSPELLKESSSFNQLMMDEGMLKHISTQMKQDNSPDKDGAIKTTDDKTAGKRTMHGKRKR